MDLGSARFLFFSNSCVFFFPSTFSTLLLFSAFYVYTFLFSFYRALASLIPVRPSHLIQLMWILNRPFFDFLVLWAIWSRSSSFLSHFPPLLLPAVLSWILHFYSFVISSLLCCPALLNSVMFFKRNFRSIAPRRFVAGRIHLQVRRPTFDTKVARLINLCKSIKCLPL